MKSLVVLEEVEGHFTPRNLTELHMKFMHGDADAETVEINYFEVYENGKILEHNAEDYMHVYSADHFEVVMDACKLIEDGGYFSTFREGLAIVSEEINIENLGMEDFLMEMVLPQDITDISGQFCAKPDGYDVFFYDESGTKYRCEVDF